MTDERKPLTANDILTRCAASADNVVGVLLLSADVDGDHYAPCFRDCLGDNREWVKDKIEAAMQALLVNAIP